MIGYERSNEIDAGESGRNDTALPDRLSCHSPHFNRRNVYGSRYGKKSVRPDPIVAGFHYRPLLNLERRVSLSTINKLMA